MKTYKTFKEMSKDSLFITYDTVRTGRIITSKGTFPVACSSNMKNKMILEMLYDISRHCKKETQEKYRQALLKLPECYQLGRFVYERGLDTFCYCPAQDYRIEMSKIRKFLSNFYKNYLKKLDSFICVM